jgi:hypothetical protein
VLVEGQSLEDVTEESRASAKDIEFLLQRELDGDLVSGLTPEQEIA